MGKKLFSLCMALALCLGLLPVTALAAAPDGQVIYVGNENVTSGGYWTTGNDGTVTAFTGDDTPADNYIHYNANDNILTLHNATIKKELEYNDESPLYITGAAIGVINQSGDANLTITLEGTNTIEDVSYGIRVYALSIGSANLTITGSGTLYVNLNQEPIKVNSPTVMLPWASKTRRSQPKVPMAMALPCRAVIAKTQVHHSPWMAAV